MASSKKRGLGRGLGALIPERSEDAGDAYDYFNDPAEAPVKLSSRVLDLDPSGIEPNPMQPRKVFNEESLEELAESIKQDGVQEPVIVRKSGDKYELVNGERRVRASIMAGLETVPAICREVSDKDMLKLGLIENIQREDLNPIELASAYGRLMDEFGWTQEKLAHEVGKKRATVTNMLRILNLPRDVQDAVARGEITMGHARALLALESPSAQSAGCRKIIEQGLSVRQAEKLGEAKPPRERPAAPRKDPNIESIEDELRRSLGTRVAMKPSGPSKGKIEIEYFNLDDLERILGLLRNGP